MAEHAEVFISAKRVAGSGRFLRQIATCLSSHDGEFGERVDQVKGRFPTAYGGASSCSRP